MNIYEIDNAIDALVDPDTGELLDEDTFLNLRMERDKKVENIVLLYKNTVAEYEAVKAEADALKKRSDALKVRSVHLKEWIAHILDGEKFSTARCFVSFRASKSVDIEDRASLVRWAEMTGNKDCLSYSEPSILKSVLKDKLRKGMNIPGVKIEQKRNLVIK